MLETIVDLAQIITGIATIAAVVVTIVAIRHSYRINKVNMIVEVSLHCASRLAEIRRMVGEVCVPSPGKYGDLYYSSYWGLKSDQFDYWLHGYLDHDTFCDSSYATIKSFWRADKDEERIFGISMDEAWERYKQEGPGTANPEFMKFTDGLRKIADGPLELFIEALHDLISDLEGTPRNPGFSRRVRSKFQHEITWEEYIELGTHHRRS